MIAASKICFAPVAGALFLCSCIAASFAQTRAVPPPDVGSCLSTATKYSSYNGGESTTSTTFVDTKSKFNITVGGKNPSCVEVAFSATADAAANETMQVRVAIDNISDFCAPFLQPFVASGATPDPTAARALNFICARISPGTHSVKLQYRSVGGASVHLNSAHLIVRYVK